jgi:hypothetical protein
MLPEYFIYIVSHPTNPINQILGLYKVIPNETSGIPHKCYVLIKNVNIIHKDTLPSNARILKFIIKDNISSNTSKIDPSILFSLTDLETKVDTNVTYNTNDFKIAIKRLELSSEQTTAIYSQIQNDTEFLSKHNIVNYSLAMYIALIPFTTIIPQNKEPNYAHDNLIILTYEEQTFSNGTVMTLQEKTTTCQTIYQIKNSKDINIFKDLMKEIHHYERLSYESNFPVYDRIERVNTTPFREKLIRKSSSINQFVGQSPKRIEQQHEEYLFKQISTQQEAYVFNFLLITKTQNINQYIRQQQVQHVASSDIMQPLEPSPMSYRGHAEDDTEQDNVIFEKCSYPFSEDEKYSLMSRRIVQLIYDSKSRSYTKRIICFGLVDYLKVFE